MPTLVTLATYEQSKAACFLKEKVEDVERAIRVMDPRGTMDVLMIKSLRFICRLYSFSGIKIN